MHVGLLIYASLETLSGGYLYDRKLVEHLRSQGDQVQVVSLPWRSYPRHLGDNFSAPLLERLAELQVDLLLQDELNHPSLFRLNRRLRQRVSYPILSIVHHLRSSEARPAWQKQLYRAVEGAYLRGVDGFIFNSRTTRQAVRELLVNKDSLHPPSVIAYPSADHLGARIDEDGIARRALQPGPLRLLFIGNLIRRKGLHTLLAALESMRSLTWELHIAGDPAADPAYTRKLYRQARKTGLTGRVHFLGRLSDQQLAAQLCTSHALAVPSSYEGFGIVYLEGMSCGLPAIGTTAGAAAEIITHGQDGFLVPPDNPSALADCLSLLCGDRQRLLEASLAARRRYLAHPTWRESMASARAFLLGQTRTQATLAGRPAQSPRT